jgi:alpha-D-ribose 1-methylphosphonate 5-triphosphate diphosphatase
MRGTLVLIGGPSGAGKDTLIRLAQQHLADDPRFVFARRVITRPRDGGAEDHEPASAAQFARRLAGGAFAMSWEAHGLRYGVPRGIEQELADGRVVIVNVSRAIIPETVRRYPNARVVIITAPVEMLAARLAERAREPLSQLEARLGRPDPSANSSAPTFYISNDRAPKDGAEALLALLHQCVSPKPAFFSTNPHAQGDGTPPNREDIMTMTTPALLRQGRSHSASETVLTNARLILEDEEISGTLSFRAEGIHAIDHGRSALPNAIDCEGDLIVPGLVEMHTDNLEKHLLPRPKVRWPNPLAAAIANDAQMAASGITTVFDAVCAGTYENSAGQRKEIFAEEIDAIQSAADQGLFRIDHFLHLRCELTDPDVPALIEPQVGKPLLRLVSLMDHTPGHRQWRNLADLRTFMTGTGRSPAEIETAIEQRRRGQRLVSRNWELVVEMFRGSGIVLASHDDTTEDHVMQAAASGCVISEFPTTREAATKAKAMGLKTIAGAPNIVRGGSHSGGVAVRDLVAAGVLDGLSSDYVPASLLQAVQLLMRDLGLASHQAFALVTSHVADMLGLRDRGRLLPQKRADLVQLRFVGDTPLVRRVWCGGAVVF